jgi:hypothetical protein
MKALEAATPLKILWQDFKGSNGWAVKLKPQNDSPLLENYISTKIPHRLP